MFTHPLFVPFNVRNSMISDIGTDINDLELYQQYETLKSFMPESDIFNGLSKSYITGKLPAHFDCGGWIKSRPTENHYIQSYQALFTFSNPSINRGVSDDNLKAYWKFNESSGDIINQSQSAADLGSGADIQITGGTYSQTGIIGNSVQFNGTSDYGVIGTSKSQFNFMHNSSGLFTMFFWMKYTDGTADRKIWHNTNGLSDIGCSLAVGAAENLYFQLFDGDGAAPYITLDVSSYVPVEDVWHMYCIDYDYNGGTSTGTNINFRKDNANLNSTGLSDTTVSDSDSTYVMHISKNSAGASGYLKGEFDEWSCWNKVLSDDDRASLYNGGSGLEIY
jgi:hypothetical protein